MKARKIKILKWQVGFGIVSLIAIVVFVLALKVLVMDWFSLHVVPILIVSGVLLILFILMGTLSIKAIFKRLKI